MPEQMTEPQHDPEATPAQPAERETPADAGLGVSVADTAAASGARISASRPARARRSSTSRPST